MSFMVEYLHEGLTTNEMESELINLIGDYNEITGKYLIIYSVDFQKIGLPIDLSMDDFYTIKDFLKNVDSNKLSFFIETPGGSGEAAEAIADFLREKYDYVDFLVAGECKSAGTILVMCGDEICLNETGSLGPIDAQITVGRHQGSAHDYMRWIDDKMNEADEKGSLNNFDALMVAQITPAEIKGVENSLKYGEELVSRFLSEYKFKNWNETETRKEKVTEDYKVERAKEIATKLSDHTTWKSHGRSLKLKTLEEIGLKIKNINDDEKISELVERIHVLLRLIFSSSATYKIIVTNEGKLSKAASLTSIQEEYESFQELDEVGHVEFNVKCPNCGQEYGLYAKFVEDNNIDEDSKNKGLIKFPMDSIFLCKCGDTIDLSPFKKEFEKKYGEFIY